MPHNQSDITFFAKTNFRNQEQVFGIKTDDRRRHMYVIGKTGMGKTNLLENLAIQDIQKGHGIAFIDPHGDTAEKLIKAIPSHRINDVIYLNPSDQDFPIAFNVMEKVDPEFRHLVASGLVGVFKKIWADSWGPRLEYILRNAILALLEYPGSTLLGVTRILVDKPYRARVVEKITDPVVRSFWVDEFSLWSDRVLQEVISPIQNKVGQFLSSSLIRNIVGQSESSFDIRQVMDGQKILIINLSKGRIGEDNGALLGAMMITKIQLAAMARVDIPEDERKDFYLYVDEFQNFATESFANILSEARKYHLNLILANQYVTQIDEKVRDAIFGNAGTIISFRVGAMDAEFLEKEFEPVFMMNDIINLAKYQIYLKLMIDGIAGDAFSATTLPPIKLEDAGNDEKIIKSSRERYSSSRAEVEDRIRRWSGMLTPEERQAIADEQRGVSAVRPASQPQQTMYQTAPKAPATLPPRKPTQTSTPGESMRSLRPAAPAPVPRPPVVRPQAQVAQPQAQPVPVAPIAVPPQAPPVQSPQPEPEPENPPVPPTPPQPEIPKLIARMRITPMSAPPARVSAFEPPLAPKRVPFAASLAALEPKEHEEVMKQVPVTPPVEPEVVVRAVLETVVAVPQPAVAEVVPETAVAAPEKILYPANCASCDTAIEVPFVPDGKRPTFCRDCLRDYQRSVAKARNEIGAKNAATAMAAPESEPVPTPAAPTLSARPKTYASLDAPMSLAQMQYVGPKKFKSLGKRPAVNLDEVRALINDANKSGE
jgi:CxxC-x17-CxxC domain-containing protein